MTWILQQYVFFLLIIDHYNILMYMLQHTPTDLLLKRVNGGNTISVYHWPLSLHTKIKRIQTKSGLVGKWTVPPILQILKNEFFPHQHLQARCSAVNRGCVARWLPLQVTCVQRVTLFCQYDQKVLSSSIPAEAVKSWSRECWVSVRTETRSWEWVAVRFKILKETMIKSHLST